MNIQNFKLFRDKCYINGEWVEANSKDTISVNNPATLKEIGTVPKCGKEETKNAIDDFSKKNNLVLKIIKNKFAMFEL